MDRLGEAEPLYLQWLSFNPGDSSATYFLAGLLQQRGEPSAAAALFRQVLRHAPRHVGAWLSLGTVCKDLGDLDQAIACFEEAIRLQPSLAVAHFNLGVVLHQMRRVSDALGCYERAISLRADHAQAYHNRGSLLAELNRFDEALQCFDRALALQPHYGRAYSNRGAALAALNRLDEALDSCDRALALMPADAEAYNNRGWTLARSGRVEQAIPDYQRALQLAPDYVDANWNLGLASLRLERFAAGWPRHEYRWKLQKAVAYRHGSLPRWTGAEPLAGRRVLAWSEQGFGDTLQFCRYVPMLAARGAQVVLEVQPELKDLMGRLAGVTKLVSQGEPVGECDRQIPLLSLPLAFSSELDTIPAQVPYLAADADRVEQWRQRLEGAPGTLRVGIACSGSTGHLNDRNRTMRLAQFAPLYDRAQLVWLQKDVRAEDQAELRDAPIRDFRPRLSDFADTAALIECLDLVISVDTAVVHLAGALGKTVWVLLSSDSDWRWMLERSDSPWYPSARLFRQQRLGDWEGVMARVVAALDSLLQR
jgi:tetratricopeptide (TPR) repeat protein